MSNNPSSHGRTAAHLLISRLLDARDTTSPLTLILDTAEQSCRPLLREYLSRAQKHRITVTFVSFETLIPPQGTTHHIQAWNLSTPELISQIKRSTSASGRHLLIFDSLYNLLSDSNINITTFLLPLIIPSTTCLAIFHADQPLPPPPPYGPSPFQLLHYTATTILTVHSLPHVLDEQRARQRANPAPQFGIHEPEEGILQGLHSCEPHRCVVEMEHRRRSGRAVGALFVINHKPHPSHRHQQSTISKPESTIKLLDETTEWRDVLSEVAGPGDNAAGEKEGQDISFELGLTEKQRKDRECVVLPYFDAQRAEGLGEGGRILYEMGVEDDFDEEEDEI
ncbi:MAG: hypothetical protein Q9159_005082 [Coniocarpon cinnabarinum]